MTPSTRSPFLISSVAFLLFSQPFLQLLQHLFVAELLQAGPVGFRQVLARRQFQPLLGHHGIEAGQRLDALEVLAEGPVEAVVEGFILDQQGARQQVEVVQAAGNQPRFQGFEQGQQFLGGHRQLARLQVQEEIDEH